MPGRSFDPIGNVPQFDDFRCTVNRVAHACQVLRCCPKDFELPVQDKSEVRLHDLSVGLLQRSQSGVRRKVGNVPTISVPGLDQEQVFASGCFSTSRFDPVHS
jgi:hypothetical protein